MDQSIRKHIVISAVNVRKGGTLTVLRDCLDYLSSRDDIRVTALVHNKKLCNIDGIEYIEIPWSIRSWVLRLWCEYVTMGKISRSLQPVDLWFSLHDTTPRVIAQRQAVYCHTSFPFMTPTLRDIMMDYKIPLFSLFTRYAYTINVRRNKYLVVQQEWMRQALSELIRFPKHRIIVAPPVINPLTVSVAIENDSPPLFIYPATADCHKNIEAVCEAARILTKEIGDDKFKLALTVKGKENRYARWLYSKYGDDNNIDFMGIVPRDELFKIYNKSTCLVFASRVESWGLPISEYLPTRKPMILADIAYSHEAAAGAVKVAICTPKPSEISSLMKNVVENDYRKFGPVPTKSIDAPFVHGWEELLNFLLKTK